MLFLNCVRTIDILRKSQRVNRTFMRNKFTVSVVLIHIIFLEKYDNTTVKRKKHARFILGNLYLFICEKNAKDRKVSISESSHIRRGT